MGSVVRVANSIRKLFRTKSLLTHSDEGSMDMDDQTRAIDHYKRKLDRHLDDAFPDVILHCLTKLENLPVNLKILQETGIGKV